jgi:tetratricopeptide (TPR) repeat protein
MQRRRSVLAASVVVVATCVAFLPALQNEFVWDDDEMFLANRAYRGLGWTEVKWMFTTAHMAHYTPLTWLTLGLDYLLSGMNPVGYHATNLLLHAANAVAMYALTIRLLRRAAPAATPAAASRLVLGAAFAALVFAVHPLRVESVAWATERRDVLSTLFYLLAILAYLRWGEAAADNERPRRIWYGVSLGLFALAVLSKATAVTLPVVLIILDVHPLGRLRLRSWIGRDARRVWAEKIPFLLVSAAGSVVAVVALIASRNLAPLTSLSPAARLAISVYDVAFYLWKTVAPVRLSPLYELREGALAGWLLPVAGGVVVFVTVLAVAVRRRYPALLTVWAIYLVTLLPMLRSFQDGFHVAADRYTYLPGLGWAVLAGAVLSHGLGTPFADRRSGRARVALGAIAFAVVLTLGVLTWQQTRVWQNWETLWGHVLRLDPGSAVAQSNLGNGRMGQGRFQEAEAHFRRATEIDPGYVIARHNLGVTLARRGEWAEAVEQLQQAVRLRPTYVAARNNLAWALIRQRRPAEAIEHFRVLLEMTSDPAMVRNGWGLALSRMERYDDAIEQLREAVKLAPGHADAHYNWGVVLVQQGQLAEAGEHFAQAVRSNPAHVSARMDWGLALMELGHTQQAIPLLQEAARLAPRSALAHHRLGQAFMRVGNWSAASEHLGMAVDIAPDLAVAHADWALVLLRQGSAAEALSRANAALRVEPSLREALEVRAKARAALGRAPFN